MENKQIEFEPGDGFDSLPEFDPAIERTGIAESKPVAVAIYNEPSFTIPELADKINKSVTIVRRYIANGLFPNAYKDGPYESSKFRIPQRDVDRYIQSVVNSNPTPVE